MPSIRALIAVTSTTVREFVDDDPFQLAAALSYYTLLSMAPLLLVVIGSAGLFLSSETVQAQILEQMRELVGQQGAALVGTVIERAAAPRRGVIAIVAGIVILVLGATTVFVQIQTALNRIWHVEVAPRGAIWGFIRQRLLSLALIWSVGFLLLASLVISALLSGLQAYLNELFPGAATLGQVVNILISLGLITVLIALIFKFLPDADIAWQDIWFGAFLTTLLFTIGKFLIGLYLGRASVGSAYGAAGSAVVLMVWIYYASLILFFGAKITQVMAHQRGARLEPSEHAQARALK